MRHRLLFGAVLALGSIAALAACGGSSSETPPPLQPDPAGFRYASTSPLRIAEESDAGDAPQTQSVPESVDGDPKPRVPGRSTWGSGTPPH
ncbi:MAG: hypothetical protein WDO74_03925 [Pseudomonadota bacterium]